MPDTPTPRFLLRQLLKELKVIQHDYEWDACLMPHLTRMEALITRLIRVVGQHSS